MGTVNLKRVAEILGMDDPGLEPTQKKEPGRWLYSFNNKYVFVAPPTSYIKTDSEVETLLRDYPSQSEMEVTFAHLAGTKPIIPSLLEARPGLKTITVKDAADLCNHIYVDTNVPVDPAIFALDIQSLGKRVNEFMGKIKERDAMVQRLKSNAKNFYNK